MNELVQIANDGFRAVTSKAVRRQVVYTALLVVSSVLLYGVAVIGYIGFYYDYVPHQVRTTPVYLQYGSSPQIDNSQANNHHHHQPLTDVFQPVPPPFGIADLTQLGLKSAQEYDVSVVLTLPKSPTNLAQGNFMVELALLSRGSSSLQAIAAAAHLPPPVATAGRPRDFQTDDNKRVLFAASRPALLGYTDPLVARASRLLFLPYYLFAPAAAETTTAEVRMAESLAFGRPARTKPSAQSVSSRGADLSSGELPAALYLELRSEDGSPPLRTYAVEVVFAARLRGLRWLMYQHRVLSFALLTSVFWAVEVLFMVLVFLAWGALFGGFSDADDDDADTITAPSLPPALSTKPKAAAETGRLLPKDEYEDSDAPTVKQENLESAQRLATLPPAHNGHNHDDDDDDDDLEKVDMDVDNSKETVLASAAFDAEHKDIARTTGSTVQTETAARTRMWSKAVP